MVELWPLTQEQTDPNLKSLCLSDQVLSSKAQLQKLKIEEAHHIMAAQGAPGRDEERVGSVSSWLLF